MKCCDINEFLLDYMEGELKKGLAKDFDKHIADCPDCVAFVNTYKSTVHLTRSLTHAEIPAPLKERLQSFLQKHKKTCQKD